MQRLRQARFLARLVLAWFALSLGVAIASPLVKPEGMQMVCSGGVMKLLVAGEDGEPVATPVLDCPLCGAHGAPPPSASHDGGLRVALPHVLQPVPAARLAARTAAPLPARGPPSRS